MLCTWTLRRVGEAQHYLGRAKLHKGYEVGFNSVVDLLFQYFCGFSNSFSCSSGRRETNGILRARRGVLPGPLCSRTSPAWRWPLSLSLSLSPQLSSVKALVLPLLVLSVYWAVTLPKAKIGYAASKFYSISELLGKTVLQPSFPSNLHFCVKIKSVFKDSLEDQFRVQFWLN